MWWGDYYASGGPEPSATILDPTSDGDPDREAASVASDVALSTAIRQFILGVAQRQADVRLTSGEATDWGELPE
jgi:hypothetical protein